MLKFLTLTAALLPALAFAEPAIVYSTGGKFDKSFNEGAWTGAKAWAAESGEGFAEFEIENIAQSEQALRQFARRGNDPIVAIGFTHAEAMAKVAPEFPDVNFTIVDMVVDAPNVQSIVYREQEGSYIVGRMAAMKSESGVLGFVGGMDIPLIRRFACGYRQGAASVSEDVEVLVTMTGVTPAAWSNPGKGAEITRGQIADGADIIMQAAGGTGVGVLQAAADAGKLGIGTDSNQNGLHPGRVFTTMLKRVDVAVQKAFSDWSPGIQSLGVAERGIGFALDDNNRALLTAEIEAAGWKAAYDIASGAVEVHDFTMTGDCPF